MEKVFGILAAAVLAVAGVVALFLLMPQFTVYKERLYGEAELAHAHASRQVLVQQAQAEKDAALLRAEAIQIAAHAREVLGRPGGVPQRPVCGADGRSYAGLREAARSTGVGHTTLYRRIRAARQADGTVWSYV